MISGSCCCGAVRFELSEPPTMLAACHCSRCRTLGASIFVFVRRENGQLEPREVRIGATADDRIEIVSGLVLGDTVVASATFLVDAESNLGTALGGMGDMPGMEITTPPTRRETRK